MPSDSKTAVIIADEDEYFRIAFKTLLEKHLSVSDVQDTISVDDAIQALRDGKTADLLVVEMGLLDPEALTTLKAIRSEHPTIRIMVLGVTARKSDLLSILRVGINGFVLKDVGADNLVKAIDQVLKGVVFIQELEDDLFEPETGNDELGLTPRQFEVMKLIADGKSNKEIGQLLDLAEGTIKAHMKVIFKRLGVKNRAAAAIAGLKWLQKSEEKRSA
ncbi:response regulator transcription factor [Brucella ciceri]|uniref:LuxR C-terminal-related transcriptional regulator n=1 Tax=Brucella ciceri TaxID=391287 RepID=UPI001F14511A|nr:response regulator transcription factor [Brucella ciceri]MCH6206281.1 response regulator transcription factor [Brucella ciceri]